MITSPTGNCIVLEVEVPRSTGNNIGSDTLAFELDVPLAQATATTRTAVAPA